MSYEGEQIDPVNHGKIPAGTATASDRAPSSTKARKPPRAPPPALAGTESFSKLPAGERVTVEAHGGEGLQKTEGRLAAGFRS